MRPIELCFDIEHFRLRDRLTTSDATEAKVGEAYSLCQIDIGAERRQRDGETYRGSELVLLTRVKYVTALQAALIQCYRECAHLRPPYLEEGQGLLVASHFFRAVTQAFQTRLDMAQVAGALRDDFECVIAYVPGQILTADSQHDVYLRARQPSRYLFVSRINAYFTTEPSYLEAIFKKQLSGWSWPTVADLANHGSDPRLLPCPNGTPPQDDASPASL